MANLELEAEQLKEIFKDGDSLKSYIMNLAKEKIDALSIEDKATLELQGKMGELMGKVNTISETFMDLLNEQKVYEKIDLLKEKLAEAEELKIDLKGAEEMGGDGFYDMLNISYFGFALFLVVCLFGKLCK